MEIGKVEQRRKIPALMELNFPISGMILALGSVNQITQLKIWLMECYPYMTHGNILDTVCDGYEMPQFMSLPLSPYRFHLLCCCPTVSHVLYNRQKNNWKINSLCTLCWMTLRSVFQCKWIIVILLASLCPRSLKMTSV